MSVTERIDEMRKDLADLARKLNSEGEHEGALQVQQAIVALDGAMEGALPYHELDWEWVSE